MNINVFHGKGDEDLVSQTVPLCTNLIYKFNLATGNQTAAFSPTVDINGASVQIKRLYDGTNHVYIDATAKKVEVEEEKKVLELEDFYPAVQIYDNGKRGMLLLNPKTLNSMGKGFLFWEDNEGNFTINGKSQKTGERVLICDKAQTFASSIVYSDSGDTLGTNPNGWGYLQRLHDSLPSVGMYQPVAGINSFANIVSGSNAWIVDGLPASHTYTRTSILQGKQIATYTNNIQASEEGAISVSGSLANGWSFVGPKNKVYTIIETITCDGSESTKYGPISYPFYTTNANTKVNYGYTYSYDIFGKKTNTGSYSYNYSMSIDLTKDIPTANVSSVSADTKTYYIPSAFRITPRIKKSNTFEIRKDAAYKNSEIVIFGGKVKRKTNSGSNGSVPMYSLNGKPLEYFYADEVEGAEWNMHTYNRILTIGSSSGSYSESREMYLVVLDTKTASERVIKKLNSTDNFLTNITLDGYPLDNTDMFLVQIRPTAEVKDYDTYGYDNTEF